MSPIGRIFIVLNLILSAAFLGWAANAWNKTEDYQKQIRAAKAAHDTELAAKAKEMEDLTVSLNQVTEQQRQLREGRDAAQAEADRLKTQLDEAKRAGDTMQANLTKIQATLGDYNNSIQQLTQQKDAAVERAHEAERARDSAVGEKDTAMLAQRDAEEATRGATTRIGDLESESAELRNQVSTLETRLAVIIEKTGIKASDVMAQPSIDAYVLDVNRELKLVFLNKGKKDEVKVGYTFNIYRGSQFKGRVRIENVQDSISSARILDEKTAIASGDSASTSL